MKLDPQKFFIALMDIFSILLPGALFTYLLMGEVGPVIQVDPYPKLAGGEARASFLFVGYLLATSCFCLGRANRPFRGVFNMPEHNLFYYPYASFTDTQLPPMKVATMWFDNICGTPGGRWTPALAKVPQHLQTDQIMRELMGDFARIVAGEAVAHAEGGRWGSRRVLRVLRVRRRGRGVRRVPRGVQ